MSSVCDLFPSCLSIFTSGKDESVEGWPLQTGAHPGFLTVPFFGSGVGCRVLVPLIVSVFPEVQEVPKAVDTEEDSSEEGGPPLSPHRSAWFFKFLFNCHLKLWWKE